MSVITDIRILLQDGLNLADVVWSLEATNQISKKQIPPIIHTLLCQEHGYNSLSFNLTNEVPPWRSIYEIVKNWVLFDIVIVYYQPQFEILLINPVRLEHWKKIETLLPYELLVVYLKANNPSERVLEDRYLLNFKTLFEGEQTATESLPKSTPDSLLRKGEIVSTAKYAVHVTNELFHYGNVEAWKNIVESYLIKYPESKVLFFYGGKQINRIASLFKWGEIHFGDSIFFSVLCREIKEVAKLKKYLTEGASPRFKPFIKKNINMPLKLF